MILIFCLSNLFIPSVLSVIDTRHQDKFVLYTYEKGIYIYFKSLNLENVDLFLRGQMVVSRPLDFWKERRLIFENFKRCNILEIYFFHNSFGGFENWLIYKLSKSAKVFYCPIFSVLNYIEKWNAKSLFHVIISKVIYRAEVSPLWNGQVFVYKLRNVYFSKINAMEIKVPINHQFINKVVEDSIKLDSVAPILLMTGSVIELNHVNKQEYIQKMDTLIRCLGFHSIHVKAHPRYPNKFSLENELAEIPAYVPANMLLSRYDIFIGYTTSVITEAAENGRIAISLVDYLVPQSTEGQTNYRNYLLNNLKSGHIFFPKNLIELLTILEDHGNRPKI